MNRTVVALLPLAALVGCSFYPDPEPELAGPASAPQCSTEILKPANFTEYADEQDAADPHEATLGSAPTPEYVRLQWPSSDPSTSAAFVWRTDLDTRATLLEYGVGEALDNRVQGASFIFDQSPDGSGGHRLHEVRLCGDLEPGTTYSYRVGGDGAWSPTYQFSTPGAPGTFDSVRVAFAGDSRGAQATWAAIVEAAEAYEPDLYVFSGDMVDIGTNQTEWDLWLGAAEDVFRRKGLIPAHGNHEFLASNYFAQFSLPNNEEWFSIDFGPLHFVSLNDTVRDQEDMFTSQVNWMEQDLAATDATWKIVTHHRPVYSACSRHSSDEELREAWAPVFDRHGVDFDFAGHNHIYERSVPIFEAQETTPGAGTMYMVSGGAGAPLYEEIDDTWFNAVANPTEHFIIGDFGPDEASFTAYDLSGTVIDSFTVPSSP